MSFLGIPEKDAILYSLAHVVIGIVETISGGGGLILLPVLLNIQTPYIDALFTSKIINVLIYIVLLVYFHHKKIFNLKENLSFFAVAFLGGFMGGKLILFLNPKTLEMIIPIIIIIILIYFIYNPLARVKEQQKARLTKFGYNFFVCLPISIYDGFIGPASGSMFIVSLVFFFAYKIQKAIAITKFLNGGTVLGGMFALAGGETHFVMGLAVLQTLFMGIGAIIGGMLVVYKADKIARPLIIIVSSLTLLNFIITKIFH